MSFQTNIHEVTDYNNFFRKVISTGQKMQIVVMNLKPGEDIGEETHNTVEQILFNFSGSGQAYINGIRSEFNAGDVVVISPGDKHNIVNIGNTDLKIYTIYSPANHLEGRIHKTKLDAENDEEDHKFGE